MKRDFRAILILEQDLILEITDIGDVPNLILGRNDHLILRRKTYLSAFTLKNRGEKWTPILIQET
jgi:hypothetical protein